eukprot:Nitzschia sp. Nitz4//scaffold12_size214221//188803//190141//NITZ4_001533-RA/size214221-augustus-gene-0.37-mRNA-1//-1//CDS//3329535119//2358//frame0
MSESTKPQDPSLQMREPLLFAEDTTDGDFPQGCQFSPDGLCILTSVTHNILLYNTVFEKVDPWKPVLTCPSGDSVRSFAWYPHMNSSDPSTCCFVGAARDQPVRLFDAYTGQIRASYRPYNALDEMESPTTVCFVNNGQQVLMGGFRTDRMLHIFDLNRPGRDSSVVLKLGKTRRSKDGQKGIISALASSESLLAAGTFAPGSLYLYDQRAQSTPVSEITISGTCIAGHGKGHSRKRKHFVFASDEQENDETTMDFSAAKVQWYHNRARTGVTQVEFSTDGNYLFSASRRSGAILQWDLRRVSSASSSSFCPGVASFPTCNDTNQRLDFVLVDNHLWVGGTDQSIRVYDTETTSLVHRINSYPDAVNGLSIATIAGKKYLASATGSRKFPSDSCWDDDDSVVEASRVQCKEKGWLGLSAIQQ